MFVLGAMSFRVLEAERAKPLTIATWLVAAAIAFVSIGKGHVAVHVRYGVLVLMFTALVALAAKDWLTPLRWRPLVAVGRASYSLYLIHQILGFYVIATLERIGAPPLVAVALALVMAVCVALLLRVVVEAPGQRLVRGWLGLRKAPPMMPSNAIAAPG